ADGLSAAISSGNVNATIGFILYGLLSLFVLMLVARVVGQFFVFKPNTFLGFAYKITDPVMIPVQKIVPRVGMFDVSIMVVLIVVFILQAIVMNVFIR
nr:YggT family protein [Blastocatellia bacterium]